MPKQYDLVLFGATGFTGRQAAHYLDRHAPHTLEWAIAGRSAERLAAIAEELSRPVPQVVADALDPESMGALAANARVVCSTVGPFAKYGDALVAACVEHNTHYCDITGETPWVRSLIDRFHDRAVENGTQIVPFCGFDSIPSDLGTWTLVRHFADQGHATQRVRAAFKVKGGLNGGTIDSAITAEEQGTTREMTDPVLLNPEPLRTQEARALNPDDMRIYFHADLDTLVGPFFMAPMNTRVVRRSAALHAQMGHPYGDGFTYQEHMALPSRVLGYALVTGMATFRFLLSRPWSRRLLGYFVPKPGEGPSDEVMDNGYTAIDLVAFADDGQRVRAKIRYPGDPGNRATIVFLCESALLLALRDPTPARIGGILTPATALGLPLVDRLRTAGMTWTIEDSPSS